MVISAEKKVKATAEHYIKTLGMEAHIEGGYFKELYKSDIVIKQCDAETKVQEQRAISSTIYYLLQSGDISKFHRLGSDEIWFYHDGSPLIIHMISGDGELQSVKLGLDTAKGERPQVLVPANTIFGAEVERKDSFGFVSCMVSPGFEYKDFQLCTSEELTAEYPEHFEVISRFGV